MVLDRVFNNTSDNMTLPPIFAFLGSSSPAVSCQASAIFSAKAGMDRFVQEALEIIEKASDSCVLQPTVAILCGDVNLEQDSADACCQLREGHPDQLSQWHTQTSTAGLSGDVAFVRGCESQAFDVTIGQSYEDYGMRQDKHDFFGVTVSVPLFRIPKKARWNRRKVPLEETAAIIDIHKLSVKDAAEDSEMKNSASVSLPSAGDSASAASSQDVGQTQAPKARNALTHGVAAAIVSDMKAWYADRIEDDDVATTWKHLHSVLFKKVRVPNASDIWRKSASVSQPSASEGDDPVDGLPMVVSEEFVAQQVKKVIERREQWLRYNHLPLEIVMDEPQKDNFLAELKKEYHGSADQLRRQANDKANTKNVQAGKKQRWSRETQRRGGTTQMFHLLSFAGRWDPSFFAKHPVPQQLGEQAEQKKQATRAAVEARAQLRLARKYDGLKKSSKWLYPDQLALVAKLHDGSLEAEANRLTRISGHGRLRRRDGTYVDIGGSTGGFTRAVLYNWTLPSLDDEFY